MKTQTVRLAVCSLILLGGCLPSLNPVYRHEDLIFDPAMLGVWQQENSTATWEFTKRGELAYQLVYTDKQGRSGRFGAHLAEMGGIRVLDLFPEKSDIDASAFYQFHLLPIHTIYLVKQTTPRLELTAVDLGWLKDHLTRNPEAIAHVTVDGRKVITAPTKEVQAFVLKHRDQFTGTVGLQRTDETGE